MHLASIFALAALPCFALACSSSPSAATGPATSAVAGIVDHDLQGTLAFVVANRYDDHDVIVLSRAHAAGGATAFEVGGPIANAVASLSPDGARIAYGGGATTRIPPDAGLLGTRIAQIVVRDLATEKETVLTSAAYNHDAPAWSPDGKRIFYGGGPGLLDSLYAIGTDGSGDALFAETVLMGPACVAPDGAHVLYLDPGGVQRVSIDGTGASRLISGPSPGYYGVAWSPDGARIALVSSTDTHDIAVSVANADGTGLRVVVRGTDLPVRGYLPELAAGVAWSPDGTMLAFNAAETGRGNLWVVHVDGSGLTRVASYERMTVGAPSWSAR